VPSATAQELAVCGPNIRASAPAEIDPLPTRLWLGIGPQHGDGISGAGLIRMWGAGSKPEHQQCVGPVLGSKSGNWRSTLCKSPERCGSKLDVAERRPADTHQPLTALRGIEWRAGKRAEAGDENS